MSAYKNDYNDHRKSLSKDPNFSFSPQPNINQMNSGDPSLELNRPLAKISKPLNNKKIEELFKYIRDNIIGADSILKVVYCDYIASGKNLRFIEEFIFNEVLPDYANTHTTTTKTASQTTHFRHEARKIIKDALNCNEKDVLIFNGSGSTGAIHKLIHNLALDIPPVVLVGPFEHHSNLLPWRHLAHRVVRLKTDEDGTVSKESVITSREGRKLIVALNAASNITGIITNVDQITALVHKYNGYVFWDYACGAPYMPMDMNPDIQGPDRDLVYKDAIYFSVHKFVGGPQTPGVLCAKKELFNEGEMFPDGTGGGTVKFVTHQDHIYIKDVEEREEGGTPSIIESIRAGMTLQLKEAITAEVIMQREEEIVRKTWNRLAACPNLIILGGSKAIRLPVFSFLIRKKITSYGKNISGRQAEHNFPNDVTGFQNVLFLHHNFVVVLLNDLFGIQSRGGCACAGPYAMDLLGINESLIRIYEKFVIRTEKQKMNQNWRRHDFDVTLQSADLLRPGFSRFNLAYFSTEEEQNYILDALAFVATHGWKFLPMYTYEPFTTTWKHRDFERNVDLKNLSDISYNGSVMSWRKPHNSSRGGIPESFDACLKKAHKLLDICKAYAAKNYNVTNPNTDDFLDHNVERVRWFLMPVEAAAMLLGEQIPSRPYSLPLNVFSPFHPGSIERCFCPDLALIETEKLMYNSNGIAFYDNLVVKNKENKRTYMDFFANVEKKVYKEPNDGVIPDTRLVKSTSHDSKLWVLPPKPLFKSFLQAVRLFNMIRPGDRILVCLSGGKNSISLLHCMRQYQIIESNGNLDSPTFTIAAITVDPGQKRYMPKTLIPYILELGVPFHFEEQDMLSSMGNNPSYCSKMKRGTIYSIAKRYNYNVIALGQNLDDIAASFLMSAFHNSSIQPMEASIKLQNGNMRVIRPFVLTREVAVEEFVNTAHLPCVPHACPMCIEANREQDRIKRFLIDEEHVHTHIFESLSTALMPLLRHLKGKSLPISIIPSRISPIAYEEKPQNLRMSGSKPRPHDYPPRDAFHYES